MEYIVGTMVAAGMAFLLACFVWVGRAVVRGIRRPAKRFTQYEHHGQRVWVRADLMGKHRQYCLCFDCKRFHPGEQGNCPKAQQIYGNCVRHCVVSPVWECPTFTQDPSA